MGLQKNLLSQAKRAFYARHHVFKTHPYCCNKTSTENKKSSWAYISLNHHSHPHQTLHEQIFLHRKITSSLPCKETPPLLHTPHNPMMTYEYLTIYICPLQWYELYKNQQLCSYFMLSGPNPIQWSYQCGSKGLSNPALWNCPRVEELSCSQCHRKKIVNFLHTKHVSHIVLYYNNIMKMPWCPYPMPPKKSTKKHKMGNMYSGTFSNKRTSKSLFKKSKVQLKKPCCPLTTATITTSFIQPIFLPWNHFLKNEIYSLTDIAITIRYTTHISANGLLIEWFFR